MFDEILRQFNGDLRTKEAFHAFVVDAINEDAIERMYRGEDVSHIKDAKDLIDKAFSKLDIIYGIKQTTKISTDQSK